MQAFCHYHHLQIQMLIEISGPLGEWIQDFLSLQDFVNTAISYGGVVAMEVGLVFKK